MSPRMGVITTGIAITLSVILGLTVTSANTDITGMSLGNFGKGFETSQNFTGIAAESSSCSLDDDAVGITFTDGTDTIGTIDGTVTVDGCTTTVDATVDAKIGDVTSEA